MRLYVLGMIWWACEDGIAFAEQCLRYDLLGAHAIRKKLVQLGCFNSDEASREGLASIHESFSFRRPLSAWSSPFLVDFTSLGRLDEDESSGRRTTVFEGHRAPVVSVCGDAGKIVSGSRDGTIRVWDLCRGSLRFVIEGVLRRSECHLRPFLCTCSCVFVFGGVNVA